MKDTFYSVAITYLKNHQGGQGTMHAWLNWDLANLTSVLSIGILCDDNYMINFAINYFKNEDNLFAEVGNIKNAIPFIHQTRTLKNSWDNVRKVVVTKVMVPFVCLCWARSVRWHTMWVRISSHTTTIVRWQWQSMWVSITFLLMRLS